MKQTNVVLILSDDQGAWTLGSYGCREGCGQSKTAGADLYPRRRLGSGREGCKTHLPFQIRGTRLLCGKY